MLVNCNAVKCKSFNHDVNRLSAFLLQFCYLLITFVTHIALFTNTRNCVRFLACFYDYPNHLQQHRSDFEDFILIADKYFIDGSLCG